jgi:hypothetical protein
MTALPKWESEINGNHSTIIIITATIISTRHFFDA